MHHVWRYVGTFYESFVPVFDKTECFSIDECFLDLTEFNHLDLTQYGQSMRQRVRQWVGLPVCVGIGSTKILSKLANRMAKKDIFRAWNGGCDLNELSEAEIESVFSGLAVDEVCGVGRQLAASLNIIGIDTVQALKAANPVAIRKQFGVVLEKIVHELNGIYCLEMEIEEVIPDKQQIMCSRSFGEYLYTEAELQEPITEYMNRAAEKLRRQGGECGAVQVFVSSNRHRENEPQYSRVITVPLEGPTDDSFRLVRSALLGLKHIYKSSIAYRKVGVCLCEINPKGSSVRDMFFDTQADGKTSQVMSALDEVNKRFGRRSLGLVCCWTGRFTILGCEE